MIKIKRAYDKWEKDDGFRIVVDGLWPRGVGKTEGKIDLWLRQVAPTPPLRKWFGHETKKFPEFSRRYKAELDGRYIFWHRIKDIEREKGTVTLLYGSKDIKHNNAVVLKEYLEQS
jgi:uncharacterized protein YeaO (DUF488 family)